jgi:phosphatidylglycerol:prolipoprotein diacylglycerol transferase
MYLVGYLVGYRLALGRIRRAATALTRERLDALVWYLVIGMLVGARLTYVLVYDAAEYRTHPAEVLAIWRGGLSFHGALIGMAVACVLFAHRHGMSALDVTDTVALCGAPGLFFGRIGNFINGELYGRPSSVPWAMVFPSDPLHVPRHPSQLYEALAEGVFLPFVLWMLDRRGATPAGSLTGVFVVGYGLLRFLLEFTREPDAQLGLVLGPFSMGQLLSILMVFAGIVVLWFSVRSAA